MNVLKRLGRNAHRKIQHILGTHPRFHPAYSADGLAIYGKNISFMQEPDFARAWAPVEEFNRPFWPTVPDIRWRAHTCLWAARQALHVKGDFVELGVNTGILSSMICRCLDFGKHADRRFFLFDTFTGIPGGGAGAHEDENIRRLNEAHYGRDVLAVAGKAFEPYPNVKLVPGKLPDTLGDSGIEQIAYLSIDLNSAMPEIASAEILWPKLAPGAIVVLDDYAFNGHEQQYAAWSAFAAARGFSILTLPTGQGLIVNPQ